MSKARTVRVVLYALLIFFAGAVTGALIAPIVGRTFMRPPRPEEMAQHMMDHLRSDLRLTNSQVAQIQPLVKKAGVEMEAIRRETMRQVHQHLEETNKEISAHLTPEQQVEFKKMRDERRERLRHAHPFLEPPAPPS